MNCSYGEKVSMMMDGELPAAEAVDVRTHIEGCGDCRDLERDFMFFRRQLSEPATDIAYDAGMGAGRRRTSFWKKGISVPVPVFAGFLLLSVALSIGLIMWRSGPAGKVAVEDPTRIAPTKNDIGGELSISRFDKGGRSAIYIAPRAAKAGER